MNKKSIREKRKQQKKKKDLITRIIWIAIGVGLVGIVGYLILNANRPLEGDEVAIMANSPDHVPVTELPQYTTNPPTSGPHFSTPLDAGFYENFDQLPANSDGYLVHNLEHGYVILWYNCEVLSDFSCDQLKNKIRTTMNDYNNIKIIAVPRNSIDVPLAMTSWGHIAQLNTFDENEVRAFIKRNRNHAPENNAN